VIERLRTASSAARRERVGAVINALTDFSPADLADLYTLHRAGRDLDAITVAWVGDGNNVLNSWLEASTIFGFRLNVAVPDGFEPDAGLFLEAERRSLGGVRRTRDPHEAVRGADVIYTDTWTSMGQEREAEWRRVVFAGYQVNERLLSLAHPDALFLHCLPAHRGEEVTDAVLDGPQSVVIEQAANRLHLQKALMVDLAANRPQARRTLPEFARSAGRLAARVENRGSGEASPPRTTRRRAQAGWRSAGRGQARREATPSGSRRRCLTRSDADQPLAAPATPRPRYPGPRAKPFPLRLAY
jgi:hypothetical protein